MTSCQEEMRLRGHHPLFPCDVLSETALLPGLANDSSRICTRLSKSLLVFLYMLRFCVVALGAMNLRALPPLGAAPSMRAAAGDGSDRPHRSRYHPGKETPTDRTSQLRVEQWFGRCLSKNHCPKYIHQLAA